MSCQNLTCSEEQSRCRLVLGVVSRGTENEYRFKVLPEWGCGIGDPPCSEGACLQQITEVVMHKGRRQWIYRKDESPQCKRCTCRNQDRQPGMTGCLAEELFAWRQ